MGSPARKNRKDTKMKKMMIAACAVALAAASQAATCNWMSGNMYVASSADGGWASGAANSIKKQSALVYMAVFTVSSDDFATLAAKSSADLWASYGNSDIAKLGTTKDGSTTLVGKSNNGTAYLNSITISDDDSYAGVEYAVVVAAYHDATYDKDFYIATTAQSIFNEATKIGSSASLISGQSATGWTAVPEPTSGLLMLVGLAGLALRRKRA